MVTGSALRYVCRNTDSTSSFQYKHARGLHFGHAVDLVQATVSSVIAVVDGIPDVEAPEYWQNAPAPHACITQRVAVLGY